MYPFEQKPQLTAAEFSAALRAAGFGVEHARIVDTSGRCPGFVPPGSGAAAMVLKQIRRGRPTGIDRPKTLAKAIRERDAEIERRTKS